MISGYRSLNFWINCINTSENYLWVCQSIKAREQSNANLWITCDGEFIGNWWPTLWINIRRGGETLTCVCGKIMNIQQREHSTLTYWCGCGEIWNAAGYKRQCTLSWRDGHHEALGWQYSVCGHKRNRSIDWFEGITNSWIVYVKEAACFYQGHNMERGCWNHF